MGARRKRSGGKRPSGEARLARLAEAGLVKKRDFKREGGKLTRASSDKLRRLDKTLGKYLRSPDFALYKPKSVAERRKLEHVLPEELRKLKLSAVPIRVERRTRIVKGVGKVVKNKLKRVRVAKDGTVRIDTDGPSYLYPKLSKRELLSPKRVTEKLKKLKGKNRSLRVLTGVGTLNRMHPMGDTAQVAAAVQNSVSEMLVYSRDPREGTSELKPVRGVDFMEGVMVEIRKPARARPRETERRKKVKSRSRGKAK